MFDGDHGQPAGTDTGVTRLVTDAAWGNAARHADRPALVDPGRRLGYGGFAAAVPAAAAGLRRHGVRPGDTAALHLSGVCDLALAVHAVSAAGAVPTPLPRDAPVAELAAMMSESGARLLLTCSETAAVSLAATERSFVRQVFAFGDVPDATPFARLVEAGGEAGTDAGAGPAATVDWAFGPPCDLALRLCAPPEKITHADRLADLHRLDAAVGVNDGDVLVCAAEDCTLPTRLGLIDLCLLHGATLVGVPDPGVTPLLAAIARHRATLAVVTPAKLRALAFDLAFDSGAPPVPGVRLLVTGYPDPEVVRACRERHGWDAVPLG
ncbi:AMP-binding protein [Actinomadura hibisca]|uniref:AMP-binding protein n=1 Tax=Actinomadura hibisca TaxID=68565 RepID=UPI0008341E9A|nr:class I adenylate-forming enzyme family protein [Actinomadura hibisca]